MLLRDVSIRDLYTMLAPHMNRPTWPGLSRNRAPARMQRAAKRLGVWKALSQALRQPKGIEVMKRSLYREYVRIGVRSRGDQWMHQRLGRIQAAALGVYLGHPDADLDHLQDLLWAQCDLASWIWCAHTCSHVDLGSSRVARVLAEVVWLLDKHLEADVKARVHENIARRVLEPATDPVRMDWWATAEMNWNHVCNANTITAALYEIHDAHVLANTIHPMIQRLDYALQGFAEDGGCREGPSYWNYGFGRFLEAAVVVHQRTGGALNLMEGEHVKRICRYPLASNIDGKMCTTFADASHCYLGVANAFMINRFHRMPELYDITAMREGRGWKASDHRGNLDWRILALYRGQRAQGKVKPCDYLLPDLGQAILRANKSKTVLAVLAVLAGDNGVPHNHNDIGTFMLYKKGVCFLTDPGAPHYTRKTFSDRRYEILFCRSRGHSVPVINGQEQPAGEQYCGSLWVDGLNGQRDKLAVIDMTKAYKDRSLKKLVREFRLAPNGTLTLTDAYEFRTAPKALEEAFITYERVSVASSGKSVTIRSGQKRLTLACSEGSGRFRAARLVEESKEGRTDRVVTRITFTPTRRSKRMRLVFEMK